MSIVIQSANCHKLEIREHKSIAGIVLLHVEIDLCHDLLEFGLGKKEVEQRISDFNGEWKWKKELFGEFGEIEVGWTKRHSYSIVDALAAAIISSD